MDANNTLTRGEIAQLEREAAERRLIRKIAERKRLEAMKADLPKCRPGSDFGDPQRIEWHLSNWRSWLESGEGFTAYISVAVGLSDGGTSKHFGEMVEAVDRRCALAMHSIVHALPEAQRLAVLVDAGQLPNVFRFREPLSEKLEQAKVAIGAALKARGIW